MGLTSNLYRVLPKEELAAFLNLLKLHGEVYGPVKISDKSFSFQRIERLEDIDLGYKRTLGPPKKFFIKPKENIFSFDKRKNIFREPRDEENEFVIFGVHACDINALNLLNRVFLEEMPDKYYKDRRAHSLIVGISCLPDENCFCKSTGTSYANDGYDIFLHDIGDRYLVRIGSTKGYAVAIEKGLKFREIAPKDLEDFNASEAARDKLFVKSLDVSGLQTHLDLSFNDPLWKEYGDRCLNCGNCNMVCPRCRCWDVKDYVNLDINTGGRTRMWYSCMLNDHGLVAGGLNFRPTSTERIRNRFNCKGSLREGLPNCVGCGRCTVYCPADIDFVEVMKRVRGEKL